MIRTFEEFREYATGKNFTKEMFDEENKNSAKLKHTYNKYVLKEAQELIEIYSKKVETVNLLFDAIDKFGEERIIECYKNGLSCIEAMNNGKMNGIVKSEIENLFLSQS